MIKETCVLTVKERYELGNNINSKVLAFAFGLSAEIEREYVRGLKGEDSVLITLSSLMTQIGILHTSFSLYEIYYQKYKK